MYYSMTRHEGLRKVELARPHPSKMFPGPEPLKVNFWTEDGLYVSLELSEAAQLHERIGKALERAVSVTDGEPGTILSLTFDR
jgi:hypothetical protein